MQEQFQKRHYHNCISYIMIYAIVGILTGLMFDALFTFLLLIAPGTARGIASYMGIATLGAAFLAIFAPKLGYKKIMIVAVLCITVSLMVIVYSQHSRLLILALIFLMTGITLFDVIFAPFLAAHSTSVNRTSLFTKASLASILGLILGTSIGGPIIVWIFSKKLEVSYHNALLLTKKISALTLEQYQYYMSSNRIVLLIFAVISLLMLFPILLIKESQKDYKNESEIKASPKLAFSVLMNKYALVFLVYTIIGRFAATLIAPQVSIYLTKIGINRASISLLGTLSYVAILIFTACSPRIVRKLGTVYAIAFFGLASVPFMAILANGNNYRTGIELTIGMALFFRAGLSNASIPSVNVLTMELISKNYRSLYASLVFVMQSIAQIFAGFFAKSFLFNQEKGYANAYYYAAVLYIISNVLLLIFFSKKFNRSINAMEATI